MGTEAIGSVEQGFSTQKVSRIHNGLSVAFLACLVIGSNRLRSISVGILSATLAANVLFLTLWHAHLTSNMDFAENRTPTWKPAKQFATRNGNRLIFIAFSNRNRLEHYLHTSKHLYTLSR